MTRPADSWRERAACAGLDGSEGRPDFLSRDYTTSERKRKCAGCPVRLDCLEFALTVEAPEPGGLTTGDRAAIVYGGLDGRQRQALLRRYGRDVHLAVAEVALADQIEAALT